MLSSEIPGKKTYEEAITEAIGQIPVYSKEWTNFNPSDPGITILENFTAFQLLQQESLLSIPDKVREKLLDLVGFHEIKEEPASVLLKLIGEKKEVFLKHQKFYAGEICFEINEETEAIPENIEGIYRLEKNVYIDILPEIQKSRFTDGYLLFGENPKKEDELFFLLQEIPKEKQKLVFYMEMGRSLIRNADSPNLENIFAVPEFFVLTENGYVKMETEDQTEGFIRSGKISLTIPSLKAVKDYVGDKKGYLIKCCLKEADYDIPPHIRNIYSLLFPVVQKETKSIVLPYECKVPTFETKIKIKDAMIEENYITCFCKEGDCYRKYEKIYHPQATERYYTEEKKGWGEVELSFYQKKQNLPIEKICCVLSSEDIMIHRTLGILLGYDEQEISIEPFFNVLSQEFCVMTKQMENSEERYHFFAPNETEDGSLQYRIDQNKHAIIIMDAGNYEGAEVLLVGCVVFCGQDGNIRKGNTFIANTKNGKNTFLNPADGHNGHYREGLQERTQRFTEDLHHPVSLVTQKDFEYYVKNLPELCIHKVNAYVKQGTQNIFIAVKPYGTNAFPRMSKMYQKIITEAIEEKRMLSTQIQLVQPVYTAIHVNGTIYIKEYYANYKDKIKEIINSHLDYVNSSKRFGETISFYEIYGAIERLDCVEEIFELSLTPDNAETVKRNGLDLKMAENCLCYAGEIQLEFHTHP